ncbi:MAG: penicillin-binding protein 2 [Chloroflexi bacterium]|nr:penicillin-binding protein 2 [Chloroflexota bacterium]
MKKNYGLRYFSLGIVFVILAIAVISRLVQIQIGISHKEIETYKQADGIARETLIPARGQIFDRQGNLLAGGKQIFSVALNLNEVRNPETIATSVSIILGLEYNEIYALASQDPSSAELTYITLDSFATLEEFERLDDLQTQLFDDPEIAGSSADGKRHSLSGLVFDARLDRRYPEGALASNVIGFINLIGESTFGVEAGLENLLSGVEKSESYSLDPNRALELPNVSPGASVILTIDRTMQASVEEILDSAINQTGSQAGTIIVMHPRTGEIMAMASWPRMDINQFGKYFQEYDKTLPFNKALDTYEPGSVFKIITMAAGLDTNTVEPDTSYIVEASINIGGANVINWDGRAWGPQTMTGCMQHSLNVCLAWLAQQVGQTQFYEYVEAFDIGSPTGISLDNEPSGLIRLPHQTAWTESDLGRNSYGQSVSVTPLQMLKALSSVANEGVMVRPRILHAVVDRGYQYEIAAEMAGTPISAETAQTLSEMLAVSLVEEASAALLPHYRLAGKTGTASIPTTYGYDPNLTNASFVGWGPVDDPQFMIYVWLEKPTISRWASAVAAPVFRQVAEQVVVLMDIPPDDVRLSMSSLGE